MPGLASTIHVPSDQPTIQAGLTAATAGDTVLVACGAYYEHDLVMKSGVCLRSEAGSADCVTIDAQQQGSVILCHDVDDAASIVGFTITGGSSDSGGGIYLTNAAPRIAHCDIISNTAVLGGGIRNSNSSPLVEHCRILDNHAVYDGAGACCTDGSPVFSHCLFAGNEAEIWGGGLELTSHPGAPVLSYCTIVDNSAGWSGGGIFSADQCQFSLQNTIIAFNRDNGGIYIQDGLAYLGIQCCDVYGNVGGDYTGDLEDLTGIDGNISEDPLFCVEENPGSPYSLRQHSPCAGENNPDCGQIGAFGIGCIVTSVSEEQGVTEYATWSELKSLF